MLPLLLNDPNLYFRRYAEHRVRREARLQGRHAAA